jgi:hypothetical protein
LLLLQPDLIHNPAADHYYSTTMCLGLSLLDARLNTTSSGSTAMVAIISNL